MPLEVSFLFGGISTEYDGSVISLTNIVSSYLALYHTERPFSVRNLYHVSRNDGLVREIPFHNGFTIGDLQAYMSDSSTLSGRTLLETFSNVISRGEYVVNLLHGQFGEDGGAQTLATLLGLRGTFGDPHVASLTMNKFAMSSFVSSLFPNDNVKIPKTVLLTARNVDDWPKLASSIQGPIVVKPNSLGSSLFAELFHEPARSEAEIDALLRTIFSYDNSALIQAFIPGNEYTCGCLIRSSDVIPLPIVKIDADRQFCSRDQKYPGNLSRKAVVELDADVSKRLQSAVKIITSSIALYNMARFDFRVTNDGQIWFLECNYIPSLGEDSSFVKMLHDYGMSVLELIPWIAVNSAPLVKTEHFVNYESV
ncbi:ATP-grasp domain-containing protein [Mesorhizobium sp.]|uniref:D-alanine--D-alanine ligase family protein n=1 Tax=Mesorhizobium sp. TaxID=1871066 RepID=UPI000FE6BFBF|nr:ATP-grasp domain-containing protein [Mesorhizobium sp.]RWO82080.1 MAG: ATP-grasp domain-containing protein [Mesorhizobium sp.]